MKKADIYLLLIIIILCSSFIFIRSYFSESGAYADVIIDSVVTESFPLNEDIKFEIQTDNGINELEIRDGRADIILADCRDKYCVNQHSIEKNGEEIVCLPHKLVIRVRSDENKEYDSVTN